MPYLGDFFRLNTPAGFVSVWDTWLQEGLAYTRGHMGPQWQDNYMSAPIWRFSLGLNLVGPTPVVGVLMPSVDRVGRAFPFTLMAPAEGVKVADSNDDMFEQLETLALGALEDSMTRETLAKQLGEIKFEPKIAYGLTGSLWRTAPAQGNRTLAFKGLPHCEQMPPLFSRSFKEAQETRL